MANESNIPGKGGLASFFVITMKYKEFKGFFFLIKDPLKQ